MLERCPVSCKTVIDVADAPCNKASGATAVPNVMSNSAGLLSSDYLWLTPYGQGRPLDVQRRSHM